MTAQIDLHSSFLVTSHSSPAMRTFIAIELPPPLQAYVRDTQARLRRMLPPQTERTLRWTQADKVHLTLRFLGETNADQCTQLTEALNAVGAQHARLQLSLQGLGAFPQLPKPSVLWLGVAGEVSALLTLQQDIEETVHAAGFAAETRPFAPHLTIARVQRDAPNAERRRLGHLLRQTTNEKRVSPSFTAPEIVHMRSDLHPSGAVYSVLTRYRLGGLVGAG
jgi:2'-5' RNA ligase